MSVPNSNAGLKEGFSFEGITPPATTPAAPIPPVENVPPTTPTEPIELIPKIPDPIKLTEPPPVIPMVPPVINEEQILKDIFGEGHPKSFEEAKAIKVSERLTELRKLNEEHVRSKSEIDHYKGRVSLMESPQFLTATKFSNFAKETGIDDYGVFRKLETFDPVKLDDLQKVILLEYVKYGEAGRSREEIMQQFKLGDYAESLEEDAAKVEKESDKKALKREALLAEKELSGYKEKITNFKPEFQDNSAEKKARQEAWKEAPEKMLPFFTKIDLPITEVKGIKIDASYQITPEDQSEIKQEIKRIVESNDMELTQENANLVYLTALSKVKERREAERFTIFGEKLWSAIDMSLKARYSNYQGLDNSPERKAPEEKKARTDGAMTSGELAEYMLSKKPR
jgi:hypothetical protein